MKPKFFCVFLLTICLFSIFVDGLVATEPVSLEKHQLYQQFVAEHAKGNRLSRLQRDELLKVLTENTTGEARIHRGWLLMHTGNPDQAMKLFERLVKEYPNNDNLKIQFGHSMIATPEKHKQKGWKECVGEIVDELNKKKSPISGLPMLNIHYNFCLGKREELLPLVEAAVADAATDKFELNLHIGIVYSSMGDFDKAVEYFKLALKENPDSSYIHYKLSHTLVKAWRHKEATPYLEKMLTFSNKKDAHWALHYLGVCRLAEKRYKESEKLVKQSLKSKWSNKGDDRLVLGLAYLGQGQKNKANI